MIRVIELGNYGSAEESLPDFLVTESDDVPSFDLSPHLMKWTDQILIHDLRPVKTYWNRLSKKTGISFEHLLREKAELLYGKEVKLIFCSHPWQGLVALNCAKQAVFYGPFRKQVLRALDWNDWFAPLKRLEEVRAKQENGLLTKIKRMSLAMDRLKVTGPFFLMKMTAQSLNLRYGKTISQAWEWTFQTDADLRGFPWIQLRPFFTPKVKRSIDDPIHRWDQMIPLLQADLSKLCKESIPNYSLVGRLDWIVTLFSLKKVTLSICFRNPHPIHSELEHKTCLMQLGYAFEALAKEIRSRDEDLDLPEDIPFVSWEIIIPEMFQVEEKTFDLFFNWGRDKKDTIYEIENKLPVPLQRFDSKPAFDVNHSYSRSSKDQNHVKDQELAMGQWKAASTFRPLFVLEAPTQFCPRGGSVSHIEFLERCAENWWTQESFVPLSIDFFRAKENHQWIWLAKTQSGEWIRAGVFS